MDRSPARLNLEHLKKQAKELIRLYRRQAPEALARFRRALPAAAGRSDAQITALNLRLHDAQSCVARDLGFASWPDLRRYVEAQLMSLEKLSYSIGWPIIAASSWTTRSDICPVAGSLRARSNFAIAVCVSAPMVPVGLSWP